MKRLLRMGSRHPEATASALRVSATTPASGVVSIDNSRGASAVAAELSAAIDTALGDIGFGSHANDELHDLMQQLDSEVATYSNSTVDESKCTEWKCSKVTAQAVLAACKCTLAAYDTTGPIPTPGELIFELDKVESPSMGGTIKTLVSTVVIPAEANEFLPALVIAVRGTASKIDHLVNANAAPRNAETFLGLSVDAHSGFLNSAEALDSIVSERMRCHIQAYSSKAHVIFTGHSAGGAVASLLFLRRIFKPDDGSSPKLSCITFGAPPVVTQPVGLVDFPPQQPVGLCLNIINEFDIVTRADAPYMLCLANLLRSRYDQSALPDDTSNQNAIGSLESGSKSKAYVDQSPTERNWPIPPPRHHHVGTRVILLTRLDRGEIRLKTVEVPEREFSQLLFCRTAVHRRRLYHDRIEELAAYTDS